MFPSHLPDYCICMYSFSLNKTSITLMLKLFTNTSRKENYRLILLKNKAANSLREITETKIFKY